ncbi:PP2C family protein-serine/threonine phosphatase [Streptomyces sp. HB2AG]|uniref:PP2C family protein-serine/threonine phosphatase n=1 Tax=Streptomyces sp. HB2AG TaxID=2983400 RepID=UPI0022AA9DE6|nr:PP2C family protein-serine/threonine phosphatase [Streptomyces sp. HB2AG]MCZ2525084.1 PP2C family protein-serine/threonine phosphatase [Streptomyces sp. HB2AG]
MSAARLPKVAEISSPSAAPPHTLRPATETAPSAAGHGGPADVADTTGGAGTPGAPGGPGGPGSTGAVGRIVAAQDRLATWLSDLTTLHELTGLLAAAESLDAALREVLRAGASLVGAGRGLMVLEPSDGRGPETVVGLGLTHADLGAFETVPRDASPHGLLLAVAGEVPAGGPVRPAELLHPDLSGEETTPPRLHEVARVLGAGAAYSRRLTSRSAGDLGALVWLYDGPAEPDGRMRHLAGLYCDRAAEHVARHLELSRSLSGAAALREEFLPSRLPRVRGVRTAVRHLSGPRGGGDWYDATVLPEGALGVSVGGVTGSGPGAAGAMGRLRAALRAYAVQEGEDPVAVLSDLELLLRVTEPGRCATALFAHVDPERRRVALAGAGSCPPLLVGEYRTEYVETSLSAPLGMLSCWEAPGAEVEPAPGETLLLYTDGLLHRGGGSPDRGSARLYQAAAGASRAAREDPEQLCDHVLRTMLPDGLDTLDTTEDVVLLAVRFD